MYKGSLTKALTNKITNFAKTILNQNKINKISVQAKYFVSRFTIKI